MPAINSGQQGNGQSGSPPVDPVRARIDAMNHAPVLAFSTSAGAGGGGAGISTGAAPASAPNGAPVGESAARGVPREANTIEANTSSATPIVSVAAAQLASRNFLVTAGTQMRCVLQTAMDSTQPGYTNCVLPDSVFSDNGNVVLLDKGTKVFGEYHGGISQGQARLFVIWNRAVTPKGVTIALTSPAADALGRAGVSGRLNSFFFKRFSGGLLLSLVGDASAYGSSRFTGASQTFQAPNTAATAALESDLQIKPIIRVNQGAEVTIYAGRDFDFSNVYSLGLRP